MHKTRLEKAILILMLFVGVGLSQVTTPLPPGTTLVTNDPQHPVVNLDKHGDAIMDMPMPTGVDKATQSIITTKAASGSNYTSPRLTRSGGNYRHSVYADEPLLTPIAISKKPLAKKFTITLPGDDRLEAQPLILPNVIIADGTQHDLLVTSTMGNQVYAHDANDGTPLWMVRLGNPIVGSRAIDAWLVNQNWGVLSTGVIDGATATFYVVAWTSPDGTPAKASHALYAINLHTGAFAKAPLQLTTPATMQRKQRAGLTETTDGIIFIPWGTVQETAAGAHGFITAVDTKSWKKLDELSMTKTGSGAGIWQAGQAPAWDGVYLYVLTGNGDFSPQAALGNFGECFLKIKWDGTHLTVVNNWSPFNDAARGGNWTDQDLGSAPMIVMDDIGKVAGAGKDGILYMLDSNTFKPAQPPTFYTFNGLGLDANPADQTKLNFLFQGKSHHQHSTSIYYNQMLFEWAENGNLRAFSVDKTGKLTYLGRSAEQSSPYSGGTGGMPGAFCALSSWGLTTPVIWCQVPDGDANRSVTTGRIFAFDADPNNWTMRFADGDKQIKRIWMSGTNADGTVDSNGHHVFSKFMEPVIDLGRVYMGTYSGTIDVYGLP